MAEALQEVLAAYAKLPENERRAKQVDGQTKPVQAPPTGGLVLTIYDRPLGRDREGRLRLPGKDLDVDAPHTQAPHGQRSSLWLTAAECASLIPENPRRGDSREVSSKLAKRIWLYGLWPHTLWVVEQEWRPDAVRAGKLQVTVEEVSGQKIRLRMHGDVLLTSPANPKDEGRTGKILKGVENRYDARVEGEIVYDRAKKQITQWKMVGLGDYSGIWFSGKPRWNVVAPEQAFPVGFAFELDRSDYEVPPERRRPPSFVHAYIFRNRDPFYWDPEKWEEDWKKRQGR